MSILTITCWVSVYKDGRRHPVLHVYPPEYEELGGLVVTGFYNKSEKVGEVVEEIKKVISGATNSFQFGSEWNSIRLNKKDSIVENSYEYFEPFTLPTTEILILMEKWLDFLNAYENGEIPGLPYPPPSK